MFLKCLHIFFNLKFRVELKKKNRFFCGNRNEIKKKKTQNENVHSQNLDQEDLGKKRGRHKK